MEPQDEELDAVESKGRLRQVFFLLILSCSLLGLVVFSTQKVAGPLPFLRQSNHTSELSSFHGVGDVFRNLARSSRSRVLARSFRLKDGRPAADIAVVIPCDSKHFYNIPMVMRSMAEQTVMPSEVVVVLNQNPGHGKNDGNLLFSTFADPTQPLEIDFPKNNCTHRLRDLAQPLQSSFRKLPQTRWYTRVGPNYAGANRVFGAQQTRAPIVAFFDCDDYMHPQRIEILEKAFEKHTDLGALLTSYETLRTGDMKKLFWRSKMLNYTVAPEELDFKYPYSVLHDRVPKHTDYVSKTKDGKDTNTKWWFPLNMSLVYQMSPHNGWLTVKRDVLDKVPYPVSFIRGQDSVYNHRLLTNKINFNYLQLKLGLYIRKSADEKQCPLVET